jgi:DNA-binding response OmpR family regulator
MSKNILICDDDEGILDVATIVLHGKGYNVVALNDCKSIEEKITEIKPDLILLDLWMPGVGGEEISKKLKKDEKTKNIPIIVVSARRDTEEAAKKSGANDFLLKPFDIEQLEQMVDRHLR